MAADKVKFEQRHGKSRVRVGRVWREPSGRHHFAEWNVSISLFSDCLPAYTRGNNSDIVPTDTMKNTVYVKAKECQRPLSVEDFAILLGKHITSFYPQVSAAIINIIEKPWEGIQIDGQPHDHVCNMALYPDQSAWHCWTLELSPRVQAQQANLPTEWAASAPPCGDRTPHVELDTWPVSPRQHRTSPPGGGKIWQISPRLGGAVSPHP